MAITLLLVGIIVLLLVVIWTTKHHRDPVLRFQSAAPIDELTPSLAGITLGTAVAGNSVEVLENGAFFGALIAEIRAAQRTVHLETFLWKEGELGRRMVDALCGCARAGVRVRVLVDAVGSKEMGKAAERQLAEAGCALVKFHRRTLRHLGVLNERDHRKLVVVDGRAAFVGGHCIVDNWLGDAEDGQHFADISLRVRGPIVHSVQAAFSENWGGQTGEILVGDEVFPILASVGDITAFAAYAKPEGSAPAVKILHHSAICLARERIWIQNPYFIPDPEAIEAFGQAVARGVDVRVLMPAASGSDNPMVQHAGHRNFDKLLQLGVRLFEYPHTLLHQKVVRIDDAWCAVGSSNFDDRSFETNDEITLCFNDGLTAQRLDRIFERYAADAAEINLDAWRRRSVGHRLKDNLAYLINELL